MEETTAKREAGTQAITGAQQPMARNSTRSSIAEYRVRLYCLGSDQRDWYNDAMPVLQAYVGTDAALFAGFIAATSPLQVMRQNVYMAFRAYRQYTQGEPFRGFLPTHRINLQRIAEGKIMQGLKVVQFYSAIIGNEHAVPIDRWMARIFGIADRPRVIDHERCIRKIRNEAYILGLPPREYQAALWCGIKRQTGVVTEELKPLRSVIADVFQLRNQQELYRY